MKYLFIHTKQFFHHYGNKEVSYLGQFNRNSFWFIFHSVFPQEMVWRSFPWNYFSDFYLILCLRTCFSLSWIIRSTVTFCFENATSIMRVFIQMGVYLSSITSFYPGQKEMVKKYLSGTSLCETIAFLCLSLPLVLLFPPLCFFHTSDDLSRMTSKFVFFSFTKSPTH